jgi:hypothetical protein
LFNSYRVIAEGHSLLPNSFFFKVEGGSRSKGKGKGK